MLSHGPDRNRIHRPIALPCRSEVRRRSRSPTLDNQGKGEAFSPTDLVATALGTCIATTMGIVAQREGVDIRGMTVNVTKEMANDPRRIGRLTTEVRIPLPPDHPQRELLEKTGLGCPVHRSLPAEMERPTTFSWEG
jgi:uncharacterized OsmC-like protein